MVWFRVLGDIVALAIHLRLREYITRDLVRVHRAKIVPFVVLVPR
jgi:hypothetical protein